MAPSKYSKPLKLVLLACLILLVSATGLVTLRLSMFRRSVGILRTNGEPVEFYDLQKVLEEGQEDARAYLLESATACEIAKSVIQANGYDLTKDPVTDEHLQQFERLTEKYPELYSSLEKAARAQVYIQDYSVNPATGNVFANEVPEFLRTLNAAQMLMWKARILNACSDFDLAIETEIDLLRLSEHATEAPGVLGGTMAATIQDMTIDVIYETLMQNESTNSDKISRIARGRLNALLLSQQRMKNYKKSLLSERVRGIEKLTRLGIRQSAFSGVDYLEFMAERIKNASISNELPEQSGSWVVEQMMPWYRSFHETQQHVCCKLRALRIMSELQIATNNDGSDLSTLNLPDNITKDLFRDGSMIAKKKDGRWLIYSVGLNGIDDDGTFAQDLDFGIGPQ